MSSRGRGARARPAEHTRPTCHRRPSLTNLRAHYESKHPKEVFPEATYAAQDVKKEVVQVHHNQAATQKSNKNASKAVRDKVKEQQAAGRVVDESRKKEYKHTGASKGPKTL